MLILTNVCDCSYHKCVHSNMFPRWCRVIDRIKLVVTKANSQYFRIFKVGCFTQTVYQTDVDEKQMYGWGPCTSSWNNMNMEYYITVILKKIYLFHAKLNLVQFLLIISCIFLWWLFSTPSILNQCIWTLFIYNYFLSSLNWRDLNQKSRVRC